MIINENIFHAKITRLKPWSYFSILPFKLVHIIKTTHDYFTAIKKPLKHSMAFNQVIIKKTMKILEFQLAHLKL